jgi:hypothetical protein
MKYNPEHKDFDIHLEIVALLTTKPQPLRRLGRDLQKRDLNALASLIREAARNLRVDVTFKLIRGIGRTVRLDRPLPPEKAGMIQFYLDTLYGDGPNFELF